MHIHYVIISTVDFIILYQNTKERHYWYITLYSNSPLDTLKMFTKTNNLKNDTISTSPCIETDISVRWSCSPKQTTLKNDTISTSPCIETHLLVRASCSSKPTTLKNDTIGTSPCIKTHLSIHWSCFPVQTSTPCLCWLIHYGRVF